MAIGATEADINSLLLKSWRSVPSLRVRILQSPAEEQEIACPRRRDRSPRLGVKTRAIQDAVRVLLRVVMVLTNLEMSESPPWGRG